MGNTANDPLFKDVKATYYFWTAKKYAELKEAGEVLSEENASYIRENVELSYSSNYGNEYCALTEGFDAKAFGDTVYAVMCVTDTAGNVHCSGVDAYSPEGYAEYKIHDGAEGQIDKVTKWMVVYGERAKEYLKNR